jgi:hypothetical protein
LKFFLTQRKKREKRGPQRKDKEMKAKTKELEPEMDTDGKYNIYFTTDFTDYAD